MHKEEDVTIMEATLIVEVSSLIEWHTVGESVTGLSELISDLCLVLTTVRRRSHRMVAEAFVVVVCFGNERFHHMNGFTSSRSNASITV